MFKTWKKLLEGKLSGKARKTAAGLSAPRKEQRVLFPLSRRTSAAFALFRTLRFQLAATFLCVLTAVLLVVGVFGMATLRNELETEGQNDLSELLGTLKLNYQGPIQFDEQTGEPYWFADMTDPEDRAEVAHLQAVYVIADSKGHVVGGSCNEPGQKPICNSEKIREQLATMQQTHEPVLRTVKGSDGRLFEVLSSTITDPKRGVKWYIAEGRSLQKQQRVLGNFQRYFLLFFPIALFVCAVVVWYSAGSALSSLQSVEKAAQEITGSSLGVQIRKRGADDELDRLIDSFNAMSGRLKASFEQMRQFSTDVSHELRTPLTAIQGQLEVALFTATRKEQLQEAIENALQDVERLSNLVRALLLLSQSESGQIPMNKTVLDAGELVQELVDQFQIPAEAHDVRLTAAHTEQVVCEADRTQLERVITNLLSNALKYTPSGGWVRASAENAGSNVRLVVEDSGVGIPTSHLPHIFDRFYRVPDPNPEKGLGLGLSFVAAIVRAHGGEIHVDSQVGEGSRFEVILPAGAVRAPMEAPAVHS
jgi:heavy metal sensor kinase